MTYQEYIDELELTPEMAYGQCEFVCRKMIAAFPELELVRGHYWDLEWGKRQHWWLQTQEGEIVDPTEIQFPMGMKEHEPWDESLPEPTGMCPNCGEYCYNHEDVHDKCFDAYVAAL